MNIERLVCGALEANCYIIWQKDGGSAYVIDPGYDVKRVLDLIEARRLRAGGVLLTHLHHDHAGKAEALSARLGAEIFAGREELDYSNKTRVDRLLDGGEILMLDGEPITALHTPGHTAGGLCYYSEKSRLAFTGDTIFNVDIGYTHFAGGDAERMKTSLRNVVDKWANDVVIYPGHGDPASMKSVREVNRDFLEMIK